MSSDENNTFPSQEPLIIGHAESFLLRVPVRPIQVDSQSSLDAWNVLAVKLVTDSGAMDIVQPSDMTGMAVFSGLYLSRLNAGGHCAFRAMTLVRK